MADQEFDSIEAMREAKMHEAFAGLRSISPTADTRIGMWITDIGVFIRDRELHHFEVEQENARLTAENEHLKRELLATNNYAIQRVGSGWGAEYNLIHWDEKDFVWTLVETNISSDAATTLVAQSQSP